MLNLKQLEQIPILKKGGIHIKKKNRGKFTEYCGGKVTEECIRKGKNSSNPTIRKRSIFAANARKWKHQEGGVLNKVVNQFSLMSNPLGQMLDMLHKNPLLQPYTKHIVHAVNEHGNEQVPKTYGFNDRVKAISKASEMWKSGNRLSEEWQNHVKQVQEQERMKYKENPIMISRSQRAAKMSLAGSLLGGYASSILSIPDQIYDWAASIDEPNMRNNLHTTANYLEDLAKLTPTKYDDILAPIGKFIGNADDATSGMGYDLFNWSKKKD